MPSVIQLKSGKTETVFDLEDLLRLVEQHMGDDTLPSILPTWRRKTSGFGITTMR